MIYLLAGYALFITALFWRKSVSLSYELSYSQAITGQRNNAWDDLDRANRALGESSAKWMAATSKLEAVTAQRDALKREVFWLK